MQSVGSCTWQIGSESEGMAWAGTEAEAASQAQALALALATAVARASPSIWRRCRETMGRPGQDAPPQRSSLN